MPQPITKNLKTNWSGVSYGIVIGFVAAYFQFKVPPVLPVLLDNYNYDKFIAGGFMSIFAVAGMAISVRVGKKIRELLNDKSYLEKVLKEGTEKARILAEYNLKEIRNAIGFF